VYSESAAGTTAATVAGVTQFFWLFPLHLAEEADEWGFRELE